MVNLEKYTCTRAKCKRATKKPPTVTFFAGGKVEVLITQRDSRENKETKRRHSACANASEQRNSERDREQNAPDQAEQAEHSRMKYDPTVADEASSNKSC